MRVVKIPNDRYSAFENKYVSFDRTYHSRPIKELFIEVRHELFKLGYKIDSIVTVYYLLFYVFGGESDATRWNLYQSTDIIVDRAESKIHKLSETDRLVVFPS